MNDLLWGASPPRPSSTDDVDLELAGGVEEVGEMDQRMQDFHREVKDVNESMDQMKGKLTRLQDAHEESKRVTRASAMKAIKERMEGDIDQVLKIAQGIKRKIEALKKDNEESRKVLGCEEGSATDRQRMIITQTCTNKLKALMNEFQDLREKFQKEYREVVERRYFTVTGQRADAEMIDSLIDNGESEAIFQRAIQEQGRGQVMDTLAEIQERHSAVQDIEKQLLELHQIFMDMAVLVESQGELLDNIEVQVGQAVDHVQHGTKQLVEARKTQLNTRKWICCGIILVIVIIVVIVIVVLKPWEYIPKG